MMGSWREWRRKRRQRRSALRDVFEAAREGDIESVLDNIHSGLSVDVQNSSGETALFIAAGCGHLNIVRALAKLGASVNHTNTEGETALFVAARYGESVVVEALAKLGASVDHTNTKGETALFVAARYGKSDTVVALATLGASVNHTNADGETALFVAARCGHSDIVEVLAALGASVDHPNADGETALFVVARTDNVGVIRTLADLGSSLNMKNAAGETALFAAALSGRVGSLKILGELGASVNEKNSRGETALFIVAARVDRVNVLLSLVKLGASMNEKNITGETALFAAVQAGNMIAVRALAELGASVHEKNATGETALFVASREGNVSAVRILAQSGANVNERDASGETALFVAAQSGSVNLVQTLVELGASVDVKNSSDETVLFGAVRAGHMSVVQTLIDLGASINEKNDSGETVLFAAAQSSNNDAVKTLVQFGAAVNETNLMGETAVFAAAREGATDVVTTLIELGASMDHMSSEEECPLLLAGREGHLQTFRVLVQAGASVNVRGRDGETPLISVSRWNYFEGVQLIIKHAVKLADMKTQIDTVTSLYIGTLESLEAFSTSANEFRPMFSRVVKRLKDLASLQDGSESSMLTFASIMFRVCSLLLQCKSSKQDHPMVRLIASRAISNTIRDFHEELDHFTEFSQKDCAFPSHTSWKEEWNNDRVRQQEEFQELLSGNDPLTYGFADSVQQAEVLVQLLYELRTCRAEGNTDAAKFIEIIASRFAAKVDIETPVVPEWFISSNDVDVRRWNTVQNAEKRRGMWNKAHVMVTSSILKRRDFETRAAEWFSVRHPNLTLLYGACHIADPPIFVYEYDPNEISLREFLKVEENLCLVWKKLYEVARGLYQLHQRHVAHGSLRCENIVIRRSGQAKVGAFERNNKHLWKSPEQLKSRVDDELTPSLASDIYAFGLCIMEALTLKLPMEFLDVIRKFAVGELPKRVPTLSAVQWDLVVKMCTHEPDARVKIEYVVDRLRRFAMESDSMSETANQDERIIETENEIVDIAEYKCPGTTATISGELQFILSMLATPFGAEWIREKVFPALKDIYERFVQLGLQPTDPVVAMYCDLLARVKAYVRTALSEASVARLVRSQQVADRHYVIYAEVDRILNMLQVPDDDPIRSWKREGKDIDRRVLAFDESKPEVSVIGLKSQAVTLTHHEPHHASPYWDPRGFPAVSDTPPRWYLALRDVHFSECDAIGEGAFGRVYKGTWLDTPVIIKFMGYGEDSGSVSTQFFLHEVRVWSELNHPHIIKLFGANHCDKRYFVCEYASNGSLLDYLRRNKSQFEDKWTMMYQVALGLRYMHQRNIVHNDLKCDNILVGESGDAKIIDFGLSCIPGVAEILVDKAKMGAVHWKSPEYLRGERPSIETDIYSFAMCILEVLTGEFPWGNNMLPAAVRFQVSKGNIPNRPAMASNKQWNLIELMTKADRTQRVKASFVVDKLLEIVNSGENVSIVAEAP